MSHMHVLYAHDCNWTFRLECLTPDDVWDAVLQDSEHLVTVYDAANKTVRGRPLKELVANRVPYRSRGWCKAEVEWSSCRSKSEQNQWIDAPESEAGGGWAQLQGKVPMAPEVFEEDMRKAEFTHRNDAAAVLELQRKIFHQKVSECRRALRAHLPKGELSQLAKALIHYKKLKVLHLRNMDVGAAEAEEFAKVLAVNSTITELEISVAGSARAECGAFWKALVDMLKSNATITCLKLGFNDIGDDLTKALAEALATNGTVTSVDLRGNNITSEGCKGLAKALKTNGSITTLDLRQNIILKEGFKAFTEALTTNRTITTINLDYNGSGHEWLWELQKISKTRKESTKPILKDAAAAQSHVWTGKVRIQTLASRLTSNSVTTHLDYDYPHRAEGIKAFALALVLKTNRTITKISLKQNYMSDEGCKALAEALATNGTLTSVDLSDHNISDEGCKGLAKALKTNGSITTLDLALAEALKSNTTLEFLHLQNNYIDIAGVKALESKILTNVIQKRRWLRHAIHRNHIRADHEEDEEEDVEMAAGFCLQPCLRLLRKVVCGCLWAACNNVP
ncbi:NLRC3 [Symbiodinium necroappetens]|uniref:NLRC3 protein n=1 Tax=Symbiodinium necroappetens TaxID=1628268 RepID=A0A812NSL8_9DINO|nr:NLRC3 [Symbiodinium necroappetens]